MSYLLPVGIVLFLVGLVLAHIVVGLTRSSVRKEGTIGTRDRILMWTSVGLVVLGIVLSGVGYWFGGQP